MFSERAISRSVHGVEKVQFLWLCIDERMQKHAKYLILRRRHTANNEAFNDLMMHGILP